MKQRFAKWTTALSESLEIQTSSSLNCSSGQHENRVVIQLLDLLDDLVQREACGQEATEILGEALLDFGEWKQQVHLECPASIHGSFACKASDPNRCQASSSAMLCFGHSLHSLDGDAVPSE